MNFILNRKQISSSRLVEGQRIAYRQGQSGFSSKRGSKSAAGALAAKKNGHAPLPAANCQRLRHGPDGVRAAQ
jgi:hypothetical protein